MLGASTLILGKTRPIGYEAESWASYEDCLSYWDKHIDFLPSAISKLKEWINPMAGITVPEWRRHWLVKEKSRSMLVSRIFFAGSMLAYCLHFFLVDLPAGKEPISLWATYRFGLAAFSAFGLALSFSTRFAAGAFYKSPLIIAAFVFSFLQARSMLWSSATPLFFAYLLPCLIVIVLKWNILSSLGLFLLIQAFQYPIFWRVGIESHVLTSATMIAMVVIVVFRSNMSADVRSFIARKHQKELRRQLNHYLRESRKRGLALKKSNEDLSRKASEFKGLLEASHSLAKHSQLVGLFEEAVLRMHDLFPAGSFAVLYDGGEGSVQHLVGDLSPEMADFLVTSKDELLSPGLFELQANHALALSVLPLTTGDRKPLGMVIAFGLKVDQQSIDTLSLFTAELAGFSQNVTLMKRLESMAHVDGLTQAFNRNYFDQRLVDAIREHEHDPAKHFSLFLIDVNGLKKVNDSFGHKSGDQLIVAVADLLKNNCRRSDVVGRLGGDEFVILCPETKDASPLLQRLRDQESSQLLQVDGATIPVRLSIGLSSTILQPSGKVMKVADELMYEDKRAFYSSHSS